MGDCPTVGNEPRRQIARMNVPKTVLLASTRRHDRSDRIHPTGMVTEIGVSRRGRPRRRGGGLQDSQPEPLGDLVVEHLGTGHLSTRIRLMNTGDFATVRLGASGDPISIEVTAAAGKSLLPAERVRDDVLGHRVTLIDNGMPVVLLDAAEFGLDCTETVNDLEERADLRAEVERVRLAAGPMMGLSGCRAPTSRRASEWHARGGGAGRSRVGRPLARGIPIRTNRSQDLRWTRVPETPSPIRLKGENDGRTRELRPRSHGRYPVVHAEV